jgi:hypothetical protein
LQSRAGASAPGLAGTRATRLAAGMPSGAHSAITDAVVPLGQHLADAFEVGPPLDRLARAYSVLRVDRADEYRDRPKEVMGLVLCQALLGALGGGLDLLRRFC